MSIYFTGNLYRNAPTEFLWPLRLPRPRHPLYDIAAADFIEMLAKKGWDIPTLSLTYRDIWNGKDFFRFLDSVSGGEGKETWAIHFGRSQYYGANRPHHFELPMISMHLELNEETGRGFFGGGLREFVIGGKSSWDSTEIEALGKTLLQDVSQKLVSIPDKFTSDDWRIEAANALEVMAVPAPQSPHPDYARVVTITTCCDDSTEALWRLTGRDRLFLSRELSNLDRRIVERLLQKMELSEDTIPQAAFGRFDYAWALTSPSTAEITTLYLEERKKYPRLKTACAFLITLQAANDVYVVDEAVLKEAFVKAKELVTEDYAMHERRYAAHVAQAHTCTPLGEYKGHFREPVYLIQRPLPPAEAHLIGALHELSPQRLQALTSGNIAELTL